MHMFIVLAYSRYPKKFNELTITPLVFNCIETFLIQSHLLWRGYSSFSIAIADHLTLKSASHGNWCTATLWNRIMTAQWEGMGEVGSARYEPALLPPCPSIRVYATVTVKRSTHASRRAWQCKCFNFTRYSSLLGVQRQCGMRFARPAHDTEHISYTVLK